MTQSENEIHLMIGALSDEIKDITGQISDERHGIQGKADLDPSWLPRARDALRFKRKELRGLRAALHQAKIKRRQEAVERQAEARATSDGAKVERARILSDIEKGRISARVEKLRVKSENHSARINGEARAKLKAANAFAMTLDDEIRDGFFAAMEEAQEQFRATEEATP